jgi:hypothetical protein
MGLHSALVRNEGNSQVQRTTSVFGDAPGIDMAPATTQRNPLQVLVAKENTFVSKPTLSSTAMFQVEEHASKEKNIVPHTVRYIPSLLYHRIVEFMLHDGGQITPFEACWIMFTIHAAFFAPFTNVRINKRKCRG